MRAIVRRASSGQYQAGYTFIEIAIVAAIIAILASVALPLAKVTMQRNREIELRRCLRDIRTAIDKSNDAAAQNLISPNDIDNDAEGYPPTLQILVDGVEAANDKTGRKLRFLRRVPIDPMTRSTDWGLRSSRDEPDSRAWGGQNVYDVYTKNRERHLTGRAIVTGRHTVRVPSRSGGFTLIELLIVVTLLMVLAGIGLSTYSTSVVRAKEAVLREDLLRFRDSIDQYYADKGTWPPDLPALVSSGYMRQIPKDPFTDSVDSWQTVMSEPDPANPDAAPGVYDVKSGSPGTTLEGTPHAEL